MSDTKPQIQEAQITSREINAQNTTPRCIMFKLQKIKDKEKILEKSQQTKQNKNTLPVKEQKSELYPSSSQKLCKHEESEVKYLKC